MASGAISELLGDLLTVQEAVRKATAHCEWEIDPKVAGRTAWRISGLSRECVQRAIDTRMRYAEREGGTASFIGPYRDGDHFLALGETIVT